MRKESKTCWRSIVSGSRDSIDGGGGLEEDPVVQSGVMVQFGREAPTSVAAGKSGNTVQFPLPKDWSDPEVRGKIAKQKLWADIA